MQEENKIRVHIIERLGDKALVQYLDTEKKVQRAIVDNAAIVQFEVSNIILSEAINPAIDFTEMGDLIIDAATIQETLRNAGCFDESDFRSKNINQATFAVGRLLMRQIQNFVFGGKS